MKSLFRTLSLSLLLLLSAMAHGQIIINYPAAAQGLTRSTGQGTLTVQLGFTAACTGTTVTVALPASVTYVPGSVAKTAGSLAGSSIAESSISNLNAPVFAVSGITAAGDITFTIARRAGCGSLTNGKDTIKVSGSCGSATENSASTNTYNLLSPSLAITPAAAITGAFIGTTATRTTTITNGGNGALDTLRFYVAYPAAGIVNTSGTNAITANSVSFTPFSTNGDTLFYKIYGATIFGGDNLLSNGETVTITEPVKVAKCNTATAYSAGWGTGQSNLCQAATGTSNVTMALGVPNLSSTMSEPLAVGGCAPSNITVTITNNGTGGLAGAVYNVLAKAGNVDPNVPSVITGPSVISFNNFKINGNAVVVTQTGSNPYTIDASQFTTDPDGAGVGLDDLDGDGQYDDLAPGKTVTITFNRVYNIQPACTIINYYSRVGAQLNYTNMCGTAGSNLPFIGAATVQHTSNNVSVTTPTVVTGGTPFTFRVCNSGFNSTGIIRPTDSLYLEIALPAGLSYAGNAQFNGGGATVSQVGSTLYISAKGIQSNFCFNADFLYACGTPGTVSVPYKLYHVIDRSCGAIEYFTTCTSFNLSVSCPVACPAGMANFAPSARRVNYGYADAAMTTPVNPAALTGYTVKTALPYDTLNIIIPAKETGTYNNLHYYYQIDRAAGTDVLQFISGTLNFKAGGTGATISCAMPAPDLSASTAALTKFNWDFTSMLGGACGLPASLTTGDSVWVNMRYAVTTANNAGLYASRIIAPPNQTSYFYNLDASSAQVFCGTSVPDIYLLGVGKAGSGNTANASSAISGCNAASNSMMNYGIITGEPGDAFPGEFRPGIMLDSVVITLPAGISWTGTSIIMNVDTFGLPYQRFLTNQTVAAAARGNQIVIVNPGNWRMSDLIPSTYVSRNAMSFGIVANCAAAASSIITVASYGKSFVYAGANIPFVSINASGPGNLTVNYDATTKPAVMVQNNTGVVQGISAQHYWDVQINNPTTQTAPNLWVALEKGSGSGGISVDSVVLKPSNTVLAASTYNATDNWYKISTAGLTTGAVQQARVYFRYSSCTADSILFKAGWNCTGYPTPDPLTGYACTAAQTYLKVIPQASEIQMNILRQPGSGSSISLCNADSVLIAVNSAQAGNLLAPYVNVYTPAGVSLQLPVQIEYPLGSGSYQNATATAIAGGYKIDLTSHTGIGTNGLPGTVVNPSAPGRQAKLKVLFNTSCGITSGSPLTFQSYGTQPCGAAAVGSGSTVLTGGINITGATTSGSAGVTVGIGSTSLLCGASATLNLSTTPVITPTQVGDTVIYTIPAGLAYAGNFTGTGFGAVTSTPGAGGTTLVKVPLPAGIAAGTAIPYGFDVRAAGIGGCGNTGITALAKRDIAPLVCGGVPCTGSSVVIGTGASSTITLSKPSLSTGAFSFTEGITTGSPVRTVNYTFSITNTGTANAAAGAYIIKILCGNAAGKTLATFTNNAVAAGSLITQAGSFIYTVPADCAYGSPLFLQIQDTTAGGTKVCLCASPAGSTSAQVVPVKLSSFTGTARSCNAALSWRTESEISFNHFDVEQGTDNIHYNKIATIAAHGTGTGSTYAGLYSQPQGTAYYRLKMVDNDGRITYSDVITVRTNCTASIAAYPNPVSDVVTVTGLVKTSSLRLMDAAGRTLTSVISSNTTQQLDMSRLAAGIYLLQVVQDNEIIQTIKIVKK